MELETLGEEVWVVSALGSRQEGPEIVLDLELYSVSSSGLRNLQQVLQASDSAMVHEETVGSCRRDVHL